jgi:hypothetical protein
MDEMHVHKTLFGRPKEKNHVVNLGVDGKIILNRFFKK